MSIAVQDYAAHDMPVGCRKPLPVEGPYVVEALGNSRLHAAQQRQDCRFDTLPFVFCQSRDPCQAHISNRTAHPSLQKQEPQRAVLMGGQVESVSEVIAHIEVCVRLVQCLDRECHPVRSAVVHPECRVVCSSIRLST